MTAVALAGTEDHPQARMVLSSALESGEPSHAYLFHGPAGVGKRSAARALAELSPARRDPNANLLPPVTEARDISVHVAVAVAMQACKEGLADRQDAGDLFKTIRNQIWTPLYRPYHRRSQTDAR